MFHTDTVSTGDEEILTVADAQAVYVELLPVRNHSTILGVMLGLPDYEVDGLKSDYPEQRDFLYQVILSFLKGQPRPTWRVIVKALRRARFMTLALRIESAKCPDPADTSPPQTTGKWNRRASSLPSLLH